MSPANGHVPGDDATLVIETAAGWTAPTPGPAAHTGGLLLYARRPPKSPKPQFCAEK